MMEWLGWTLIGVALAAAVVAFVFVCALASEMNDSH